MTTDKGLEPGPETAVEFVVEVLAAAGDDYSNEEVADCLADAQESIGMMLVLDWAREDPSQIEPWMEEFGVRKAVSHLRLVE